MKRKALLLLVVAICLCNDVMTQDESHTFLKSLLSEDRVWTMSYSSIYQKDQVSCIESKLEGDTKMTMFYMSILMLPLLRVSAVHLFSMRFRTQQFTTSRASDSTRLPPKVSISKMAGK